MTCSGQRQSWEQRGACISAPASLSCPVRCSTSVFQCVPSPASSAGETGAQLCRTELRDDHEEWLQYQRYPSGRGEASTKALPQPEKGNGKLACCIYMTEDILGINLKKTIKTRRSLPCYTHTTTEQEQCISSQITLWRGISIPWHHSLS